MKRRKAKPVKLRVLDLHVERSTANNKSEWSKHVPIVRHLGPRQDADNRPDPDNKMRTCTQLLCPNDDIFLWNRRPLSMKSNHKVSFVVMPVTSRVSPWSVCL